MTIYLNLFHNATHPPPPFFPFIYSFDCLIFRVRQANGLVEHMLGIVHNTHVHVSGQSPRESVQETLEMIRYQLKVESILVMSVRSTP